MQWHIYARIEDNAWQYALDYLDKLKKQNLIILDIGSNVGAFSFKLATNLSRRGISNYSIYAFDPNPYIKEIFERNLEVNYTISKHIHFFPLAISKFDGTSLFDFDKNNSGTGSISDRGFPVEVVRLDKFCETHNVNSIDFIKIDVEGFEPFVFSGARRVIEKFRPAIYAEISPRLYEAKGMSAREIFEYLVSVNYKLFKDSGNNLKVIDCNSYDSLFEETQFNIVAYPN
jgi:FkbM family methyltransferase